MMTTSTIPTPSFCRASYWTTSAAAQGRGRIKELAGTSHDKSSMRMKQTRRASLIESVINTAVGFFINVAAQAAFFPLFGIYIPLHTNLSIAVIFTCISIIRGFVMRRVFETLRVNGILK
jgi:hypothetical protein